MNSNYSPQGILNFIAETLQDNPQETDSRVAFAALQESYNDFADSLLLPSAFPDKHNVQQRTQAVFDQMEFLSFFPYIFDNPFHCLIGLTTTERFSLLGRQTPYRPDSVGQNQSIPTFFTHKLSPAFFISCHGHKQFLGDSSLPALLNGPFSKHIELRRLFSALSLHLECSPTVGTIADFPLNALPDSKFLNPSVQLADTVVISLSDKVNKQLVRNAFSALKNINSSANILTVGNKNLIPNKFLHLVTKHYHTIDEVEIIQRNYGGQTKSVLYSLMAPLLYFPTWIAQHVKILQKRIADLTSGLVMLNNDDSGDGDGDGDDYNVTSLRKLRDELKTQKKHFVNIKDRVDNCLEDILEHAKVFESTLKGTTGDTISRERKKGDRKKGVECDFRQHFQPSFFDHEECFLQLYHARDAKKAQRLSQEMSDAGYPHTSVLTLYLAKLSRSALPDESLSYLSSCPDKNQFLLRTVVHFRKKLHILDDVAGSIAHSFPLKSADELYVHGTWLLNKTEQKEKGLCELRTSLSMGDLRAGEVLLNHGNNDWDTLRFLAKHHIAEANYILGKQLIHSDFTNNRGWTELKIAAALGNYCAMEEIANHEYWIAKKAHHSKLRGDDIPRKEMERAQKANANAKLLYERIISKNAASVKAVSNYGEILYNDRDFIGALAVLKNCPDTRAQIFCGRMFENSEGVAQDLQCAKQYYEKAANAGNMEALNRLKEVNEKIQTRKEKQETSPQGYGRREESRSSTTTSSGWCFITTATCLALGKPMSTT
ncbi:MAG: hypothetical protein LBS34_03370 [Rickettsiales bacterium]|jgi:hypothetical protein|nr:hypothetical protein [Rickettsiales bacterium]